MVNLLVHYALPQDGGNSLLIQEQSDVPPYPFHLHVGCGMGDSSFQLLSSEIFIYILYLITLLLL